MRGCMNFRNLFIEMARKAEQRKVAGDGASDRRRPVTNSRGCLPFVSCPHDRRRSCYRRPGRCYHHRHHACRRDKSRERGERGSLKGAYDQAKRSTKKIKITITNPTPQKRSRTRSHGGRWSGGRCSYSACESARWSWQPPRFALCDWGGSGGKGSK